jgi:RNA polymerase sigma factor (sigma-70 family)
MKVELADDTALWASCLAGDGDAFGTLWDRHRDPVFRQALRHVANRFDAEDVTGMTFLEAWRLRGRVRVVDGSVLPWLLTTCANVARNSERSRRRYRAFLEKLPAPPLVDPLEDLDTRHRAAQALDALPAVDRALLTLTAVDGLNLREAGERLGITHDAARARLSRAKARLRAAAGRVDEEGAAS